MLSIRLRCFDDVANKSRFLISLCVKYYFIIYFITPTESVEGHLKKNNNNFNPDCIVCNIYYANDRRDCWQMFTINGER